MSVVLQLQILKSNGSQAVVKLVIATQCLNIYYCGNACDF